VKQERADYKAGSPLANGPDVWGGASSRKIVKEANLASQAVNADHVLGVLPEPGLGITAELQEDIERGHIVVLKRIESDTIPKFIGRV